MILAISKTYSFDAAHQLVYHSGKCANLHGHTYSVTVSVDGEQQEGSKEDSSRGMVLDYGDLDKIVKPIIDDLDHSFIYWGEEPIFKVLSRQVLREVFGKLFLLGVRTTAENLAAHIGFRVCSEMVEIHPYLKGRRLVVSVSETPRTTASYTVML